MKNIVNECIDDLCQFKNNPDFNIVMKNIVNAVVESSFKNSSINLKSYETLEKSYNKKLIECQNTKTALTNALSEIDLLNEKIKTLNTLLSEKESLIKEKNESIQMVLASRDDKFKDKMDNLTTDVLAFYLPAKDAKDIPMSIELGECFKLYFFKIMDILMDNGVKLDKTDTM